MAHGRTVDPAGPPELDDRTAVARAMGCRRVTASRPAVIASALYGREPAPNWTAGRMCRSFGPPGVIPLVGLDDAGGHHVATPWVPAIVNHNLVVQKSVAEFCIRQPLGL